MGCLIFAWVLSVLSTMESSLLSLLPTFTVSLSFCVFVNRLLEFTSGLLGTCQFTNSRFCLVDVNSRSILVRVERGGEAFYGVVNGNPFLQSTVVRNLHHRASDLRIYFAVRGYVVDLAVGPPFVAGLLLHARRLGLECVHRGVEPQACVDRLLEVADGVRRNASVVASVKLMGVARLELRLLIWQGVEEQSGGRVGNRF